jgi:hypothetical protein
MSELSSALIEDSRTVPNFAGVSPTPDRKETHVQVQIKKVLASVAALGALGLGGSALAGAASNDTASPAAAEQQGTEANEAAEQPGNEANDNGKADESEAKVSAADAKRAEAAALAKVGPGKVSEVSAETPDPNEPADTPEKGDTPDPAYESQIAFDVEVTKADGSVVDVALDKSFNVLGTQAAEQDQGGDQVGDQGGQDD